MVPPATFERACAHERWLQHSPSPVEHRLADRARGASAPQTIAASGLRRVSTTPRQGFAASGSRRVGIVACINAGINPRINDSLDDRVSIDRVILAGVREQLRGLVLIIAGDVPVALVRNDKRRDDATADDSDDKQ